MTDRAERCTGMKSCTASPHVHGCYADVGDCDNALDHISGSIKPPVVAEPTDSPRQQLQEALAAVVDEHVFDSDRWACGCGWEPVNEWTELETLRAHRLHVAEVILESLDLGAWVPRAEHEAALAEKDCPTPTPQDGDLPSGQSDTPLNLPREKREAIAQALVGYFDPMQVNSDSDEERADMLADCRHAADCVMPILDAIEARWRSAHDEHLHNWMQADAAKDGELEAASLIAQKMATAIGWGTPGEDWPEKAAALRTEVESLRAALRETGRPAPDRCPRCGGYWDKTTYDRTSSDHPAPLSCDDPWHTRIRKVGDVPSALIESNRTTWGAPRAVTDRSAPAAPIDTPQEATGGTLSDDIDRIVAELQKRWSYIDIDSSSHDYTDWTPAPDGEPYVEPPLFYATEWRDLVADVLEIASRVSGSAAEPSGDDDVSTEREDNPDPLLGAP